MEPPVVNPVLPVVPVLPLVPVLPVEPELPLVPDVPPLVWAKAVNGSVATRIEGRRWVIIITFRDRLRRCR